MFQLDLINVRERHLLLPHFMEFLKNSIPTHGNLLAKSCQGKHTGVHSVEIDDREEAPRPLLERKRESVRYQYCFRMFLSLSCF